MGLIADALLAPVLPLVPDNSIPCDRCGDKFHPSAKIPGTAHPCCVRNNVQGPHGRCLACHLAADVRMPRMVDGPSVRSRADARERKKKEKKPPARHTASKKKPVAKFSKNANRKRY